jgi:hypothetical protein
MIFAAGIFLALTLMVLFGWVKKDGLVKRIKGDKEVDLYLT